MPACWHFYDLQYRSGGGIGARNADIPVSHAASIGGSLDEKRNQARDEALANFKFTETSLPKWNGSYVNTGCYNSANKTFLIRTPEDFAYACTTAPVGSTISLVNDIDMGGSIGRNYVNTIAWQKVTFLGNGHTVYNLRSVSDGTYAGLSRNVQECVMRNVRFEAPYVSAKARYVGLFPYIGSAASDIDDLCISNGLFYNTDFTSGTGIVAPLGMINTTTMTTVDNSGADNCVSIGQDHIGGFISGYNSAIIRNCWSDHNTVIAYGGHSGAFASCANGYSEFYNCWSNSTIYGNTDVGGFTSGCDGNGVIYDSCWSSGVVEGEDHIGGFVGMTTLYAGAVKADWVARNCYTTCMVGMNYQGTNLGGFAGGTYEGGGNGKIFKISNCYAAGEVGSIDTDILATNDCGGFIGTIHSKFTFTFTNCFYDMQTTAMKNKAFGGVDPLAMIRDASGVETVSWNGIKGITTKKMTGESNLFPSGFSYTPGLYPQISSLAEHTNTVFRAQSAASVTAVFCDDWSDIADTGFDTVRDTMRNYSFSSSESFQSNTHFSAAHIVSDNISNVEWKSDGNISPIDGTSSVITFSEKPYYTTSLSPGIEWVEVSLKYTNGDKSAIGSRRIRLIPTSHIETGGDKRVDIYQDSDGNETSPYDHKEGFATTYLDASTLHSYLESDITHPEALITFEQVISQQYADGIITGTIDLPFNSQTTNMSITATMSKFDGTPAHIDNLYEKLNGTEKFEASDCGMYRITYKAQLSDGRYLSIAKKLVIVGPWSVVYNYNYTGMLNGELISPNSIFDVQSELMNFDNFTFAPFASPPMRDGWVFAYWSLDREGNIPVSQKWFDNYEKNYGTLNKNIDVYAQWNRINSSVESSLVIDPKEGSYDGKENNEKVILTGSPGDKVIIGLPVPTEKFVFDGWNEEALGGGAFDYSEETHCWIFIFGEEDALIEACYRQNIFDCSVHWMNKHTRNDIIKPVQSEFSMGNEIIIDTSIVDAQLYNVSDAIIEVIDIDTGETIPIETLSLIKDESGRYIGSYPNCNIQINILYDTWIQMPHTGNYQLSWFIFIGEIFIITSYVFSIKRNKR